MGLLRPIGVQVVDDVYRLVYGQRTLEAVKLLGWATIPVYVISPDDPLRAEVDENEVRKAFLPSERAAIARALYPEEVRAARERMVQQDPRKSFPGGVGRAWDIIGKKLGRSGASLMKEVAVVEAGEKDPSLRWLADAMDRHGKVDRFYTLMKQLQHDRPSDINLQGNRVPLVLGLTEDEVVYNAERKIEKFMTSMGNLLLSDFNAEKRRYLLSQVFGEVCDIVLAYYKDKGPEQLKSNLIQYIDNKVKERAQ